MSDSNTVLTIVNGAMSVPGVKVNRQSFLLETLKVDPDKTTLLLEKGPIASGLFSQCIESIKQRNKEI